MKQNENRKTASNLAFNCGNIFDGSFIWDDSNIKYLLEIYMKIAKRVNLEKEAAESLKDLARILKISESSILQELVNGLLISAKHAEITFKDWWPDLNFGQALNRAVNMGWKASTTFSEIIQSLPEKQIEAIFAGVCMKSINGNGVRVEE